MQLLVISYRFPPQNVGGCIRAIKFIKYLARRGWQITVLVPDASTKEGFEHDLTHPNITITHVACPHPYRALIDFKSRWRQTWRTKPSTKSASTATFVTTALPTQPGLLARLASLLLNYPDESRFWIRPLRQAMHHYFATHPTTPVIFVHGPPFSHLLAVVRFGKQLGKRVVVDLRDHWSNDFDFVHPFTWAKCITKHYERRLLREAPVLTTVTDRLRECYEKLEPSVAAKMHTIHNGFDPEDFTANDFSKQPEQFVIAHVGVLALRNSQPFLEGLHLFLKQNPAIRGQVALRFYGPLDGLTKSIVDRLGLAQITEFVGPLPHAQLFERLTTVALFLLFMQHQSNDYSAVPGKLYEYMAMRRPVLGFGLESSAAQWIEQFHFGRYFEPNASPSTIAEALSYYHEKWRSNQLIPFGDATILERFSRQNLTGQLERLLLNQGMGGLPTR